MSRRLRSLIPAVFMLATSGVLLAQLGPGVQTVYFKASNTESTDYFGGRVALSGDTLVIGAVGEDSGADGVNGNPADNGATDAGAAYVFIRTAGGWVQQAYLKASNSDAGDQFGLAVAIDGETLVVSAPLEDSNATGVNGDETDNTAADSGAVYVFVRSGNLWTQQAYIKASNTDTVDLFGQSVSLSGDTLAVGAPFEDSDSNLINGGQADNGAPDAGAAYVFTRSGTTWTQQAYLKAINSDTSDTFGWSVGVDGNSLVVGAPNEDSVVPSGGDPFDNSASSAGAAYVFQRNLSTWTQSTYLKPAIPEFSDAFGLTVAVSAKTIVVGAPFEDSDSDSINTGEADNSAESSGAAYVFTSGGGGWTQSTYLKAFNSDSEDRFGGSLCLEGNTLIIGAHREDSGDSGIGADETDNSAANAGAAYLFVRETGIWGQHAYIKASTAEASDTFGISVALDNGFVLVGAQRESSNAVGVNGDQTNNSAVDSGAAYEFDFSESAWTDQGCALPGISGNPLLLGTGSLVLGTPTSIELFFAAPSSFMAIFASFSSTPVSFMGGTLKPFPFAIVRFAFTNPAGGIALPFLMPDGLPTGTELWVQMAIVDGAAIAGASLSNAILGVTP